MLIKCPECGKKISSEAPACTRYGLPSPAEVIAQKQPAPEASDNVAPIECPEEPVVTDTQPKPKKWSTKKTILASAGILVIILAITFSPPVARARAKNTVSQKISDFCSIESVKARCLGTSVDDVSLSENDKSASVIISITMDAEPDRISDMATRIYGSHVPISDEMEYRITHVIVKNGERTIAEVPTDYPGSIDLPPSRDSNTPLFGFSDLTCLRTGDDYYTFRATIKNNDVSTHEFVKVKLTLMDRDDRTIATETTYACGDEGIASGASQPVEIMVRENSAVRHFERYSFSVYGYD